MRDATSLSFRSFHIGRSSFRRIASSIECGARLCGLSRCGMEPNSRASPLSQKAHNPPFAAEVLSLLAQRVSTPSA
jgi:hypothetical protein